MKTVQFEDSDIPYVVASLEAAVNTLELQHRYSVSGPLLLLVTHIKQATSKPEPFYITNPDYI